MSCDDLAGDLVDLARGVELAPDLRERAQAHVADCPACRRRLERERILTAALAGLAESDEAAAAPGWIEQRLRAAVREAGQGTPRPMGISRPDRWRWATLAAVAASLAAVALLWRREPPQPPPLPVEWAREAAADEEEDAFVPVTFDDALAGLDAVQVVRVHLPRSAVGSLGLAVSNDAGQGPVEADVLVGQDGLPRAIRFVSLSSQESGGTSEGGGRR